MPRWSRETDRKIDEARRGLTRDEVDAVQHVSHVRQTGREGYFDWEVDTDRSESSQRNCKGDDE